jgi:predicted PurR-regulated permease PerM
MAEDSRTHPPVDWRRLHLWEIQPVRDLMVLAGLLALVYLGYVLRVVTVPMLLALALAYLVEPMVRWMTRKGRIGRPLVAGAFIVLIVLAIGMPVIVGGGVAVVQGGRFAQRVAGNVDALAASIQNPDDESARSLVARRGSSWLRIRDYVVDQEQRMREWRAGAADAAGGEPSDLYRAVQWAIATVRENAGAIGKRLLDVGGDVAGGVAGAALSTLRGIGVFLFGAFLTGFFFFFFCVGYGRVLTFWERLIPERRRGRTMELLAQMDQVISGFIRGRLTICGLMILLYTFGYWLVGVPAPLIMGPIIGVLTIVPYASGAVGIPVAILLMWLEPASDWRGGWWWILAGPVFVTIAAQFLDDYVLTPRIQGRITNMDAPTILFASIAGGLLAGFYGMLLGIPAAACVKILVKEVLWPRIRAWSEGRASDVLPIGRE